MWKVLASVALVFAFVAGPWFLLRPARTRDNGPGPDRGSGNGDSPHNDVGHGGGGHG
jgi:hypothetical protein